MSDVLLTEVIDRVGWITLNRPERKNALNGELVAALDDAVKDMAANPDAKVVVVTGTDGFCSGGDTKDGRGSPGMERAVPPNALDGDLSRHESHAAMLLHVMPKPTIAMVGGPAVGAGCSLAAACDLRFASEDAIFMAGFTPNGLSGDYGGTFLWTSIAGTGVARRLYLLNEKFTADEALALGMVTAVMPAASLREYVAGVASQLARAPREVIALVKNNLNEAETDNARRNWLFANEATNQMRAGVAMMERYKQSKG